MGLVQVTNTVLGEGPYLSTDQQSLDSFFGSTQSGGSLDEQDDTVHNDI